MEAWGQFFKGKKVTLMGLGLLGRGIGDAAFLASLGAHLTVTDRKTKDELASSLEQLKDFKDITYVLGEHRLEDFTNTDMVIKAAGVPLDSPYVAGAKKAGVPVYMSTALFAKFAKEAGATIVGITGTRGKSTVTHMIHYVLAEAGRQAHLGGNVRGLSTLAMLPEVKAGDIAVLELDSWQLQGFGDLQISPDIAVFTNLMQDHLNYYLSELDYFMDKANIFLCQKPGDTLIVGADIAARISVLHPPIAPVVPEPVPAEWTLTIPGEHNRGNAALAAAVLQALGLSEQEIKKGLETFAGVEGRLQKIAVVSGVEIYNDNNATTPDATVAALAALAPHKPVLIIGGADKGLPLEILANMTPELVRAVVFLQGTGTDKLKPILMPLLNLKGVPSIQTYSAAEAIQTAMSFAEGSGKILFSPGFASFGMFKNEYDRGDQFVAAVKALH